MIGLNFFSLNTHGMTYRKALIISHAISVNE